ncbi:hypothetical protein [Methanobrevibacter sp.]|jgi:hypothetical protein|uniref:hypothetical protein n=1 Tax=Methanobrevibacter sp. TaxID=66852 RepID=UPI00386BEAB9
MIEIELQNTTEFERLNLPSAGTIVAKLEKQYPQIVADTITYIKERHDEIGTPYKSIFDLVTWSELIEYIEENIPEEILINYYVKNNIKTHNGKQYLTITNGYQFINEVKQ